jgi:hypothetical protein
MPPRKDITGKVSGRLTALYPAFSKEGRWYWKCKCECGNEPDILSASISNGNTRSCGCLNIDSIIEHDKARAKYQGESRNKNSPYKSWDAMKQRCSNPNNQDYLNYGGRGITVCELWLDYGNFREWAYCNGWTKGLTIDRIDSNAGYYPENCQWISNEENARRARK